MRYLYQVLVGIDQLVNTLLGGWADETISSRAFRQNHKRRWAVAEKIINMIFFLQPDHCHKAYLAEQKRLQIAPSLRTKDTK